MMPNISPIGPHEIIEMGENLKVPFYIIPFSKEGQCIAALTYDHMLSTAKDDRYTDIFLFSHGWNNTWEDAVHSYKHFFNGYREMRQSNQLAYPQGARPLLIGIFWPSISLLLPSEHRPSMAAMSENTVNGTKDQLEQEQLIIEDIGGSLEPHFKEQFYTLTKSNQYLYLKEALELAKMLAPFYDGVDGEIPEKASVPSPHLLVEMWRATLARNSQRDTSGNFGYAFNDLSQADLQIAGNPRFLDPRWPLRLLTVRRMKDRAGTVGFRGVGKLLRDLLSANKTARLHLIGHSYGCKVLLSAICSQALPRSVTSLLLLQPAVSHLCFAKNALGTGQQGGYRPALQRIEHPILTTFSSRDQALTSFFQIAVRRPSDFAEKRIAGTPPSPYGALGGYGPGGCGGECKIVTMKNVGERYDLERKQVKIYGLDGHRAISSHGDISNIFTWWALYNQVTA